MSNNSYARPWVGRLNSIALFIFTAITVVWGKGFEAPAGSLDPSWREALVQATDQGLRFGKDIVFTFGPYHQLYTNAISDNLYPLIIGRWIFGFAWGAAVTALAGLSTPAFGWLLAMFMALSGSMMSDAPFYALQLALLLASTNISEGSRKWIWIALMYCGIIVSIYSKLSFAVSAAPIVACAAILALQRRPLNRNLLAKILFALAAIPLAIWVASGQALPNLPAYLLGPNLSIVLGYSSAMSINDYSSSWQIAAYWIGAIALSLIICKASFRRLLNKGSAYLVAASSLFLFWTSFKAGMVRHDGHGAIAGQALACYAIIALIYAYERQRCLITLIPSIGALILGLSITSQYFLPIRSRLDEWLNTQIQNTYLFVKAIPSSNARTKLISLRKEGFNRMMANTEDLSLIPMGSSTDAIPWDITDLPANGLRYQPRPIIQSYSAYKPDLQLLNKLHFESRHSPSYIVLKALSIDGRISPDLDYPSLETIAKRYQIVGEGSMGSLILKKNATDIALPSYHWQTTNLALGKKKTGKSIVEKNPWTFLPARLTPGSRFSIHFNESIWRRLQSIVFKPPQLWISVKFDDGRVIKHRIVGSASLQMPLYPFIIDTDSLGAYLKATQNPSAPNIRMGPKPIAIRLDGSLQKNGLQSAALVVEKPITP